MDSVGSEKITLNRICLETEYEDMSFMGTFNGGSACVLAIDSARNNVFRLNVLRCSVRAAQVGAFYNTFLYKIFRYNVSCFTCV